MGRCRRCSCWAGSAPGRWRGAGGRSCAGAGSAAGPRSRDWCWCSSWGRSPRRRNWCCPSRTTARTGTSTPKDTPPWWTCPPRWRRLKIARDPPGLLRRLLREPAPFPERRIPDEPVIQSGFDVYLDHGTLIYVKDRCTPEDAEGFIFAKVAPVSPEDLPADRRRQGFRYDRLYRAGLERLGDRCLAGGSLPTYPVDHVVTGQRTHTAVGAGAVVAYRELWRAEATLGAGG